MADPGTIWTPPSHSTLHIRTPLAGGLDPGERHTGITIRLGNRVLWCATIAHAGEIPTSIDSQFGLWMDYAGTICDWMVRGWTQVSPEKASIIWTAEYYVTPNPFLKTSQLRMARLRQMACNMIVAAARGRWANLRVVAPHHFSEAHTMSKGGTGNPYEYYEPSLIGRRGKPSPDHWGPNQNPRKEMRDVQAAYAIAAMGALPESEVKQMTLRRDAEGVVYFIEHEGVAA